MTATPLDLRHLRCPLPVLRTSKALGRLRAGEVLVIQCTDPLAGIDIPHLLAQTGDHLLGTIVEDGVMTFTVEKRSGETQPLQEPGSINLGRPTTQS